MKKKNLHSIIVFFFLVKDIEFEEIITYLVKVKKSEITGTVIS